MESSEPLPTINEEAGGEVPKEVSPEVSDIGDVGSAGASVEAVPIKEDPPPEPKPTPKKRAREPTQKKPKARTATTTAAPSVDVSSPQFWAGLLQTHRAAQAAERDSRYSGFTIA